MSWREEILDRYRKEVEEDWANQRAMDLEIPKEWGSAEDAAEEKLGRNQFEWEDRIPPRMAKWTPDDLDGPALDAFEEWRESKGKRNVIIMGPVGTGKSVAGHAFLRHVHACGVWRCNSISTAQLMDKLRPSQGESIPLERWSKLDVLMLDDLGTEKPSEWVEERMFLLLDERWQWERPTIATTNLAPKRLREVLGDRTYSRLQDDAIAVTLAGSDRRRNAS